MKKIGYVLLAICVIAMSLSLYAFKGEQDGWVTIFDGKSFNGWRGYCMTTVPVKWTLEGDGSMKINTINNGREGQEGGGNLIYDKKVKNFEFELEWKSSERGNSGIFYYAQEIPGQPIYLSAPEYQLGIVNPSERAAKQNPASLFDVVPAIPQNAKGPGEWNKAKIIVNKGKVEHYQNDVKVCEYTLWTPEWKELLNSSKFSETRWPQAYALQINAGGENHEGYIGVQDHGTDFWFRNVRLKILPD